MLKASVLSGSAQEEARYVRALHLQTESPVASYALRHLGARGRGRRDRAAPGPAPAHARSDAFRRAGEGIAAIADRDPQRTGEAIAAIVGGLRGAATST